MKMTKAQQTSSKMQTDLKGKSHNVPFPCLMSPYPWKISTIVFICANVLLVEVVTEQYQIVTLNAN